jgi:pimeloyl-ACP methyl ester carboxylesterase
MTERFVVANGLRIFCRDEGDGPLVLMLHGFPESSYSWRHQMAPLAEAGYRAVAIDLPGFARSDKPDVVYDVLWVTDTISAVISALGHESATVIGHDWGGLILWPFARLHPHQVAAVIGLNVPDLPRYEIPPTELFKAIGSNKVQYMLDFQDRGIEEKIYEDLEGFLQLFFLGPATVRKEIFTPEVLEAYYEPMRPAGAMTPPLEYYRNMDRNWELAADFDDRKIEVPALLILGAGDPVLPPKLADGMEERVPNLEKVVIEDCGHWTQQEQPEQTNEHILRFLDRIHS